MIDEKYNFSHATLVVTAAKLIKRVHNRICPSYMLLFFIFFLQILFIIYIQNVYLILTKVIDDRYDDR